MSQPSMMDPASWSDAEEWEWAAKMQPTSFGPQEYEAPSGSGTIAREDVQHPMRPPSKPDWERWKPEIIRRYRTQTAAMILNSLRDRGYQVTLKMLRDHLKAWGSSKNNRVQSTSGIEEPSRQMVTPLAQRRERQLLHGIDRMLDVEFGRAEEILPPSRPDVSLLFTFGKLAVDAYHRGEPHIWRKLRQAAYNVAQVDWTMITPAQHTYLLLRSMMLLRSDWYQYFKEIWATIITARIDQNHPQAQILWHIHNNLASRDIWESIFNLEQSKVLPRQTTPEQVQLVAMSKYQLANLLLDNNEAARAERVLDSAIGDDGPRSSSLEYGIQSEVYATMGRTNYFRRNYPRAAHFCRLADAFDTGSDPFFMISNANFLAESLVRGGEVVEANEVLERLGLKLSNHGSALMRAGPRLNDLCDGLEQYADLESAVARLKALQLS